MWTPRTPLLVRYQGFPDVYHARYVLAAVDAGRGLFVCVTPDNDIYAEDLSDGSPDIDLVRARLVDDVGTGGLPYGVAAGRCYDFQPVPTAGQLTALVVQGRAEADAEKLARGLPVVPWVNAVVGAACPGVVVPHAGGVGVAAAGGVGDGGAGPADPAGGALPGGAAAGGLGAGAAVVAAGDGAAAGGIPPGGLDALITALGGRDALLAAVARPGAVDGRLLAGALGLGEGGTAVVAPPAAPVGGGLAALLGAVGSPAAAGAAPGLVAPRAVAGAADDLRTIAVKYSASGLRHREFRAFVEALEEDTFPDWPVPGPRTTSWVLRFMCENAGTPRGWHSKWRADCRLANHDVGVTAHESICSHLEMAATYDQLQLGNLAHVECMVRELQMVEEKWKDRAVATDPSGETDFNINLFLRGLPRGNLCICPALQKYLSDQLGAENAIAKERRKAREERNLARPPKNKGGGRGGEKADP